jgi:type VI secretion system protein ImpF
MPKTELDRAVQQSLLDRLVDHDPWSSAASPLARAESVRRLKASVRRDLEWLLNTRRIADPESESLEELRRSLYYYGLPDITSMSRDSVTARAWLLRQVEETIATFEPRLAGVRASMMESEDGGKRELHFLIEATLRMDPNPEQVVFDTVLELASGTYQVGGADGA